MVFIRFLFSSPKRHVLWVSLPLGNHQHNSSNIRIHACLRGSEEGSANFSIKTLSLYNLWLNSHKHYTRYYSSDFWKTHEWMDVSATCMGNNGNVSFVSFMEIWKKNLLISKTNKYGNTFWSNMLYVTLMGQKRNGIIR